MRQIDVSTPRLPNTFAMVDDDDFDSISEYNWRAKADGHTFYVDRYCGDDGKNTKMQMHREILSAPSGMEVDHIDGNGLNNQKYNLRICTRSQNQHNRRLQHNNKSGFKGVTWNKRCKRWQAQIMSDRKYKYLGHYFCLIKAAKAYDKTALELFGEFANLNFPEGF